MDSLRDIAIFALEPTQGMSALNELAAYNKQAIPRLVEIANSFKTDIKVRLAAKHLIVKLKKRIHWNKSLRKQHYVMD